jgi:phosphonate transport system substrate-binding protein
MNYKLTYYPWITQHKAPEVIQKNVEIFASELEKEIRSNGDTTSSVQVLPAMEVPAQIESISNGSSHIALMNPLGFVFARQRNKSIDASVVALRIIDGKLGDSYFAQIYTHRDSGITNLSDLLKRSIGYGSSLSTSNFIIPAFNLKTARIHPFAAFQRIEFTGGHDKSAIAVYKKLIDAGAGHDGVIIDLSNQPGYQDAKEKLVTIHRSNPIPSDPIVLKIDDARQYSLIQKALISISERSPAREAIMDFWGNAQGLKMTTYKPYAYLLDAVSQLGLSEHDIFN